MTAEFAVVPFVETDVKNPGSWAPPATAPEVAPFCRCTSVPPETFHMTALLPPLETTRPNPSLPVKYDGEHQQPPPILTWPMALPVTTVAPLARLSAFNKYMMPTLPAATARLLDATACGGS